MGTLSRLVLSLDPAAKIDFSALALVEEIIPPLPPALWQIPAGQHVVDGRDLLPAPIEREESVFFVRLLERHQGEPFRAVAARLAEIALGVRRLRPEAKFIVVVDQTGLGLPVVELCREQLRDARVPVRVTGAIFARGAHLRGKLGEPEIVVGKEVLVSALTALLENDRLRLPADHPLAPTLRRELADYSIRLRQSDGHAEFGALGSGQHDDLVTALALGCIGSWKPPVRVRAYVGPDDTMSTVFPSFDH